MSCRYNEEGGGESSEAVMMIPSFIRHCYYYYYCRNAYCNAKSSAMMCSGRACNGSHGATTSSCLLWI